MSTVKTREKTELTYSSLINDINYLQVATSLAEKKATLHRLVTFLRSEGYEQLAAAIDAKIIELVRKENYYG